MTRSQSDFARAYIACGYLLGEKGCQLPPAIPTSPEVERLQRRLTSSEQSERARTLAQELSRIFASVQHFRLP